MDEKFKVKVSVNADGEIPSDEELLGKMEDAGWTGDPLDGKTVLLNDERGQPGYEVFNPVPIAPPLGWEPTPPIDELIRQRVREEVISLKGEDEIDDIVDAEDFDIGDELPELSTIYEVMGMEEEAPRPPPEASRDDRAKADAEYAELVEAHRRSVQLRNRREYERRRAEEDALYGPSERVREALSRRGEEEGGR